MSNIGNIAGGHKATLSNPRTSDEAKEHSQQVLNELENSGELENSSGNVRDTGKNVGNVIGGHKAALKNPNVSEEAKERSEQVINQIESSGLAEDTADSRDALKNTGNVVGGHKAALKNPNVSEEAKEHSQQVLDEMGA